MEIEKIRGGGKNVPYHFKTKTELSQMGLKPTGKPVAEFWNSHQWCKLYDMKETKEKKKLTDMQLAGIKKARITREENLHRKWEEEEKNHQESQRKYGLQTFGSWYKKDFVVLDTETTDLNGEIIEISIIDRHENILFNSLVKPKNPISKEAFSIHRISDNMVSNAQTWPEIYPEVIKILRDKLILIFNDEFDRQMIYNSCSAWELENPVLLTECVMRRYAGYYNLERWVSLQNASGEIVSHRSLEDCFSTLKVIKAVWRELGIVT
jgi:DNA polymerase III subunit epsilon